MLVVWVDLFLFLCSYFVFEVQKQKMFALSSVKHFVRLYCLTSNRHQNCSTSHRLRQWLWIRLTGTDILYRSVRCVTTNFSQKYSTEIYFDFDIVATLLAWLGLLVSWYYDVMKDKMSNYPRFKGNAIRIWSIFLLIRVF